MEGGSMKNEYLNPDDYTRQKASSSNQDNPEFGTLANVGSNLNGIFRNAERMIPEVTSHAYGLPGDVAQLGEGIGNWAINKATGIEDAIPQIGGKYLPTSEQLLTKMRDRQKQAGYTDEYLQPKNALEGTLSEGAKFAGSSLAGAGLGGLLGGTKAAAQGLQAAGKAAKGHLIGDQIGRQLGFDEKTLPYFRFAGSMGPTIAKSLYGLVSPGKLKKTASQMYEFARENTPEQPFKAQPMQKLFHELEAKYNNPATDASLKKFIGEQLDRFALPNERNELVYGITRGGKRKESWKAIKDWQGPGRLMDPQALLDLKEGLSETFPKISGFTNRPERKIWGMMNEAVKNTLKANQSQAPEFTNALLEGSELFNAMHNSSAAYDIIKSKIGTGKTATVSFPALALFKHLGYGKSLPAVATGTAAFNIVKNMVKYPAMRKYYGNIIKAAADNKPGKVMSSFRNLNALMKKDMPEFSDGYLDPGKYTRK